MAYRADWFTDEMHFYAATLDAPETYRPTAHVHFAEHLSWADLADSLPRHPGTSPD
jgi:hypothetical protein